MPGAMLPMLHLFAPGGTGLDLPYTIDDLDDAFGAFNVLPGGTLVSQSIGKYPFANQYVAANAVIEEPLTISLIMDAPMRGPNAWAIKMMVMSNLKSTLDSHNSVGGLYTVVTPAFMYQNLVMTALTDNSRGTGTLPQNAWRFDFEKPLIALSDLQGAQNHLMGLMSSQLPTNGQQTGPQIGAPAASLPTTGTFKLTGGLSNTNPVFPSTGNNRVFNSPAIAPAAGFPFQGIS